MNEFKDDILIEASRIIYQFSIKYGLLNHPFDGPLRPLIQTVHNAILYWPLLDLRPISRLILGVWTHSIARWKLDFQCFPSMYGLSKLKPNYPVKTELEVEASALSVKKKGKKVNWREKSILLI